MQKQNLMTKQNSSIFSLIFLGMLTAFGPFVTDMYLPTLPEMTNWFDTTSSLVQLSLTTSMIGLATGQLIFGPLSDKHGRRPLLLAGMFLFLTATIGCIFSQNITQFIGWRLVQGIAGSSGIVISRSVATDKYSRRELAKMMGIIGAINGVAPVAAPIGGGLLAESIGWTGIFWCLFIIGCLLLAGSLHFNESLPASQRKQTNWSGLFLSFGTVLRNRRYATYVLLFSFCHIVLFANIASAPFIMQQHYGFSAMQFSICFGINAMAIVFASAWSMKFRHLEIVAFRGSQCMIVFSLLLLVALDNSCCFWIYEILLLCLLVTLGLTFTAANTLAMDAERKSAGTASALLGALGFTFGGIVPPLVGIGNVMLSTGIIFVAGASGALLCAHHAFKSMANRRRQICKSQLS